MHVFKSKVNKNIYFKSHPNRNYRNKTYNFWDEKYTDEIKVRTNSTEEKNSELED